MEKLDKVQDESQKDIVLIENASSDSEDDMRHEEVLNTIRYVAVVWCTLAQPKDTVDWRRTSIFHTWIKTGWKNCKIIVDSGSCIYMLSSSLISKIGLKTVPHPSPYKVVWVNAASMEVNEWCLIPVQFVTYKDKIWCDVITLNGGHVILGRPWLFDMDVTLLGNSNICSFIMKGNRSRF